ncbi:uncharacterized protein DFL_001260 [Arthrobotrys flagrans]|uniref:Uncharacterized protein n=1 Tax=Arthrobotrys flagrans TaxID=97331 RepID=A0A437AGK3_ARTFL|nr:hypothetical protein DFL_001260 [Arthrobotrys flagrans]
MASELTARLASPTTASISETTPTTSSIPRIVASKYGVLIPAVVGGVLVLVSAVLVFFGLRILLRERRKEAAKSEPNLRRLSSSSSGVLSVISLWGDKPTDPTRSQKGSSPGESQV